MGCYMHGLFSKDGFRSAWLEAETGKASTLVFDQVIEDGLNDLADHLERHLDLEAIARIAGLS